MTTTGAQLQADFGAPPQDTRAADLAKMAGAFSPTPWFGGGRGWRLNPPPAADDVMSHAYGMGPPLKTQQVRSGEFPGGGASDHGSLQTPQGPCPVNLFPWLLIHTC